MVIIDTFYQLVERDTSKVSGLWKGFQVFGYMLAASTGIVATVGFYNLLRTFDMNCILYPNIKFRPLNSNSPKYMGNTTNITIDALLTTWHSDFLCQYCISVWMMSFVGGLTLGFFFILNPKGGKGYPHSLFSQPWKMVNPMFFVTLIMAIVTGLASGHTIGGINQFCAAFANFTGEIREKIDVFSLKYQDEIQPVHKIQQIVKATASLTFIAWISCAIILILRTCLAPDFNLQIIMLKPRKEKFEKNKRILSQPSTLQANLPQLTITNVKDTDGTNEERKDRRNSPKSTKHVKVGLLKML